MGDLAGSDVLEDDLTFVHHSACTSAVRSRREHRAEWLGNDNRKTMIKVKITGQILLFKSGTALPSPAQAPSSATSTYGVT